MKNKRKRIVRITVAGTASAFASMILLAQKKHADSIFDNEPDQKNPLEGKKVIFVNDENDTENADGERGHLEAIGTAEIKESFYQQYIKRGIDITLSFAGLLALGPVLGAISIAIKIDDPGPVLFTQKRIGQNKRYFKLHKFRSMKMSTPHDVPTHMLDDPDQYITKVGKFLRSHSLDELPQIWDIFIGNMSVIGPRPALWNQDVLTAERDKYGVNELKPGLTGWAQINGRDELELSQKAAYDGEYADYIRKGGLKALAFDSKCFIGTVFSVARGEGVVEGGTGAMHGFLRTGVPEEDPETPLGCDLELIPDIETEKKVLITGAGSYIGESVKAYAKEHYPNIRIDTIDMIDGSWRESDFAKYNCVYHVAGIAHADVGNVSDEIKNKYYSVNTDLAIEVANKAKAAGVRQFIFMSSMIVYGDSAPYGIEKMIGRSTAPQPANFYGDSKWQADKGVRVLADDSFKVAVLRPPMIYGRGSKGNYPVLSKMAKALPVFPDVDNRRSMLYIGNLCEFICKLILTGEGGLYFPQNDEYTKTSDMVSLIAKASGKKIAVTKVLSPAVRMGSHMPGKISALINKAFGNSCYDQALSRYSFDYVVDPLEDSIGLTEGTSPKENRQIRKVCIINCFDTYEDRVDLLHDYFTKNGFNVDVYTSDFRHFEKCQRKERKEDFTFFKSKPYTKNMSAERLMSHYLLAREIRKEVEKHDFDLLWVMAPPNSFVREFAGYKKAHKTVKLIFDLIDLWPETMPIEKFKSLPPFALWKAMRDDNLPVADMIVTECDLYKSKLPLSVLDKTRTVYLARDIEEINIRTDLPVDRLSLCYLGSINNIIDIPAIGSIIKGLNEYKPVEIHIIGDGERRDELIDTCREAGAEVVYHGKVFDKAEKQKILQSCHYGLNIMKSSVFVGLTMKSMDYFEVGLPLINNIKGDTWGFINDAKTGYNLDGSENIYEKICRYQAEMKKKTRELFEKEFSRDSFEKRIAEINKLLY